MTTTPSNPYESPPILENSDVEHQDVEQSGMDQEQQARRHRLSNRFISIVFGLPGLAMFVTASAVLTFAINMVFSSQSPVDIQLVFLFGTLGFLLGATMLGVAIFLWRYEPQKLNPRTGPASKTATPPESLSL